MQDMQATLAVNPAKCVHHCRYSRIAILRLVSTVSRSILRLTEVVFGNHRIIYRLQDRTVAVLTVRSFRQILPLDDLDPDAGDE